MMTILLTNNLASLLLRCMMTRLSHLGPTNSYTVQWVKQSVGQTKQVRPVLLNPPKIVPQKLITPPNNNKQLNSSKTLQKNIT